MIRTVLLGAALLVCEGSTGLTDPVPHGARTVGLGGLSTALREDVWASVVNPALGVTVPGIRAAIEYFPAPFGLAELARAGIAVNARLRRVALTLSATGMGGALYGETGVSAGLSVLLGPRACIGASGVARHVRISSYGSATSFALTLGAFFAPVAGIGFGTAVSNAAGTGLGRSGERPERTIQAGLSAGPLEGFNVGIDVWKTARFPAEVHAGAEYMPVEALSIRGGISQDPPGLTFGAGLRIGPCALDYAASFHPVLGASHVLGLVLCISSP